MRLDNEKPSDNIEDRRGQVAAAVSDFPRGGGGGVPRSDGRRRWASA